MIRCHRKKDTVIISVKDNGIGINLEKHRNDLFKPFNRFTNKAEGTGVGLYLVRNIIEKNGGSIELISEPGIGMRVYLQI